MPFYFIRLVHVKTSLSKCLNLLYQVDIIVKMFFRINLRPYDQYAKHMFEIYDLNDDQIFSQYELHQSFRYYDTNGEPIYTATNVT